MNVKGLIREFSTDNLVLLKDIVDAEIKKRMKNHNGKLDDLNLSVRLWNLLRAKNITTVWELSDLTSKEFFRIRNAGKKSYVEALSVLDLFGLTFKR